MWLVNVDKLKRAMIRYGFHSPDMTVTEFVEDELTPIAVLEKQSAGGCEGCKYIHKDEYEMPCLICKRNKMDKWTENKE